MCTPLSHAVVALGLGKVFTARRLPLGFWGLSAALAILPDLDVIAFNLGIPYADPFGHRGFTHSLLFALLVGLVVSSLTYRWLAMRWLDLWGFFFVVTASHGILDAFTNGGLGIAFFWPFLNQRFFFPWTPIEVPHIGLAFFTSGRGLPTLLSEALWVWLPTGAVVGAVLLYRALRTGRAHSSSPG